MFFLEVVPTKARLNLKLSSLGGDCFLRKMENYPPGKPTYSLPRYFLKMIFPFPRWDMLVSGREVFFCFPIVALNIFSAVWLNSKHHGNC